MCRQRPHGDAAAAGGHHEGGCMTTLKDDTERLHELGYAQELKRGMSGFSNFAVSFTIISILTGCLTTYYLGYVAGGPVAITWGWLLVGGFVMLVGAAMAEVCSSYPTAGGLYYWSAKLAPKNGPAWSWFTGWFNLIGQVAVTASIDFGFATFFATLLSLFKTDFVPTKMWLFIIYLITMVIHAALNTFGVNLVAKLNDVSVWWHVFGVLVVVAVLFLVPDDHQSAKDVFTKWNNETGWSFPGSGIYVFLIGCLLAQYTLTGYDASAHMTEETKQAAIAGPQGIVRSIAISIVFGWILLLAVTFAIPANTESGGAAQVIFTEALTSGWAKLVLLISVVAQFFCGMASMTANSRMIYSFSRDGAIPGSQFWHRINPRTRTPTNSILFALIGGILLGIPTLATNSAGVPVAFFAIVSIAVVGLYISYIIPVYLRLKAGKNFQPGPWSLGSKGPIIGWVAVIYTLIMCVMFLVPQFSPVDRNNFNYAPVAVAVVIGFAAIWWVVSARKWFVGPKVQGTPEELAAIEAELHQFD